MKWTAPAMWQGGECWILGGGPSLPQQFGVPEDVYQAVVTRESPPSVYSPYLAPIHDKHIIGINNIYQIGTWIDVLFFGDCHWYLPHRRLLAEWPGLKVTCCPRWEKKTDPESRGIKFLAKNPQYRFGLTPDTTKVSWGNNSGSAAISMAAHFGVKRIILAGFDMKKAGTVSHWHGSHGDGRSKKPTAPPFPRHLKSFPKIAEDAAERGIEIINASPDSAIELFPKVAAKEVW